MRLGLIKQVSVCYLALPVCLFFMGWLQPLPATVCIGALLFATWRTCRFLGGETGADERLAPQLVFAIGLIAVLWVFMSGIGGFTFQNPDFHWRNAIHRDLATQSWPVVYSDADGSRLLYYFTYWLPSALFGPVLGWSGVNLLLFGWTCIGVILSLLLFVQLVGRKAVWVPLVFVFFSGCDFLGYWLMQPFVPYLGEHLEWWSSALQFSSHTTTLFWVFNQSVPAWVVTLLCLGTMRLSTLGFVACLCIPFAPLPACGLAVLCIGRIIDLGHWRTFTAIGQTLRECFSATNVFGGLPILIVFALFFGMSRQAGASGESPFGFVPLYHNPGIYLLFMALEAGVFLVFYTSGIWRGWTVWLGLAALLFIPFVRVGGGADFCMRASIPGLVLLSVLSLRSLLGTSSLPRMPRGLLSLRIAILLVGAATPAFELYRSGWFVVQRGGFVADGIETFDPLRTKYKQPLDNFVITPGPGGAGPRWLFR